VEKQYSGTDDRSTQRRSLGLGDMTLLDVLKKYHGDFAAARLNQLDVDAAPKDVGAVSDRSKMFENCITKALRVREHLQWRK